MTPTARKIEEVARLSYGRLVATLAHRLGSLAAAEDALSEALVTALEHWPKHGLPSNPEGWLLTASRHRAIDRIRSEALVDKHRDAIELLYRQSAEASATSPIDPRVQLMFACAHPAIEPTVRAPLMLQTVLGLDARRMASVYLVAPGTLGQRLSRAKAKIEKSKVPFSIPQAPEEFEERLQDVLNAIYAAYAVGYDGMGSGDEKASGLASEARWLVGTLCHALPEAAEAHGLLAMILYTEARQPARVDATGVMIPLQAQDPSQWDSTLLAEAERALLRAQKNLSLGRFQLEASIQAVHVARRTTGKTDWSALAHLYRGLVRVSPTVGALTGQAAVQAHIDGPEAGLALLDAIDPTRRRAYRPWHATRAHLLVQAGRLGDARQAYDKAIGLCDDPAARAFLAARKAKLGPS